MSEDSLRDADRATQIEVMERWFRSNYEDPANRTPYDSGEGGYIYIWGGPFNAREELRERFHEIVPDDAIEELADELEGEAWEWAPTPSSEDYDNTIFADLAGITEFFDNFSDAILNIEQLLETRIEPSLAPTFYRLLYVNVITAMETYLSDAFISTVANDPALMRRFVESTPEFKSEKVSLSQVYKAMEEVEQRARSYLADVVWHHLPRAKAIYKATLDIEFPDDLGPLLLAVHRRHDIVHRNGKTKDGDEINLTKEQVKELTEIALAFVEKLDEQLGARGEGEEAE
jgi:hypothetical protein